jgi:uncharacterized protein YsxB (DUF464 family)
LVTVKLNNLKIVKDRISLLNSSNVGFEVSGHAMAGKHGEDIVCAAVSTVAQTTAISLIELAEIEVKIEQHKGFLSLNCLNLKEVQFEKFLTIMNVFWIGIREIEKLYPNKIKMIEAE